MEDELRKDGETTSQKTLDRFYSLPFFPLSVHPPSYYARPLNSLTCPPASPVVREAVSLRTTRIAIGAGTDGCPATHRYFRSHRRDLQSHQLHKTRLSVYKVHLRFRYLNTAVLYYSNIFYFRKHN